MGQSHKMSVSLTTKPFILDFIFFSKPKPVFNISLEGGCLRCGSPCLSAVIAAVPECIAPGLAVGGAISGVPLDLNISTGKEMVSSSTLCQHYHLLQMFSAVLRPWLEVLLSAENVLRV